MTNLSFNFQPKSDLLEDIPMPRDLHSKIMKRVFIAGYGKYLYLSTAVLFVNFGVLSVELYRKLVEVKFGSAVKSILESFVPTTAYFQSSASALYDIIPVQSVLATGVTAALCAYMALLFVKFHRDPRSVSFFRSMVS